MDTENRDNQQKVPIIVADIINKYRKLQDRLNFHFEKAGSIQKRWDIIQNFLLVLKGKKKYLPNNFTLI